MRESTLPSLEMLNYELTLCSQRESDASTLLVGGGGEGEGGGGQAQCL